MNQSSDQKKSDYSEPQREQSPKSEPANRPKSDAQNRGQGNNPVANSSNPKERSPRQENL